ncbi:MAG: hypothetical protein U9P36_06010 [Thermodesulfobacteriota bacterium]|nr:hypothetical protein [Thermodesulfobacteriota bacterium]
MKKLSLIFCLILFFSSVAFAADTDAILNRTMDMAGFSTEQVLRVQSMIKTAQQQGLPAEAVSSKVYEGIAKHVDPDRIVQALERVTSRYKYGYTLARKLTKREKQAVKLGNTMTAGIAAGLTRQDAEKLVNSLQTRSRQMNRNELYLLAEETMRTARDLSRQGVSSATTAEVVGKAVHKGFAANEMRTMRSTFSRQGAHKNRESLARGYGTAIDQGIQARDLENLGTGSRGFGGTHGFGDGTGSAAGNEGSGSDDSGHGDSSGGSDGSGSSGDSSGGGNSGDSGGSGGSDSSGGGNSSGSGSSGGDSSGDSGGGGNSGDSGGSGGSDGSGGSNSSGSGSSGGDSSGGSGGSGNGGHH